MEPNPDTSQRPAWRRAPAAQRAPRPDAPSFGALLRQIRDRRGLTMHQLAERAGISQGFISRLESGERGLSRENVEALAAALDAAPLDRYRLLLAAEWVVPLDPPLEDLLVLLWNDDLPPAARARIEAALEVAAAYGRAALEGADDA